MVREQAVIPLSAYLPWYTRLVQRTAITIAGTYLVFTAVSALWVAPCRFPILLAYVTAGWVIGPPIWFYFESFWILRKDYEVTSDKGRLDVLEGGSKYAAAVWLAVSTSLAAFMASDYFKKPEYECQFQSLIQWPFPDTPYKPSTQDQPLQKKLRKI